MSDKVSIVCVTYNRRELAIQCIESCFQQDYPDLEVLILVNASTDGSEAAFRERFPQARIMTTHKNLGFFPALNIAIANTTGEYVMMMDDDAYFKSADAITKLVEAFKVEPKLGAVTCNLEGPRETPIVGGDQYIPVFTTGFTLIPRKVFTEWIGYYPDIFFRSAGETFVCSTLWDMGKPVKRLEHVRMHHEHAMHGRSMNDFKFYGLRSQVLCTIMRDPWFLIAPSLLSKASKSFSQFVRWGHPLTWAHVWLSALVHLPEALRLRRPISWRTQKLLWRLRKEVVRDVSHLPEYKPVEGETEYLRAV